MRHHKNSFKRDAHVSRRMFLQMAGAATLGAFVRKPASLSTPIPPEHPVTVPRAQVAIAQVKTYDREAIEAHVQDMIERLGGLSDVVKPGDTVAIKTNLTGGVNSGRMPNATPIESFITHPLVVRALVKQVQRAGARHVYVVEAVYEWESYRQWGYEEIADELGAELIDLNERAPFDDFVQVAVGNGHLIYPSFVLNKLLTQVDVFISVSKLKNHYNAGVTHTMKNLFGLVPLREYRLGNSDSYRTAFHGTADEMPHRIPRIIVDLNRARPIHFGLIDGIKTIEGGEGPWIPTTQTIEPGLLIAGKNCVATDAVATALMGHSPNADMPTHPFLRGDNHLKLAAAMGLGTNRLEEIKVLGVPIEQVKCPFHFS